MVRGLGKLEPPNKSPEARDDLSCDSIGTKCGDDAHHSKAAIQLLSFFVVRFVHVRVHLLLSNRVDIHSGFFSKAI